MMAEKLTIPYKRPIKPVYFRKRLAFVAAVGPCDDPADLFRVIEPLSPEDGGGFLALVPDLPGCMSDGASPEEAVANVQDAIDTWIEAARTTWVTRFRRRRGTWSWKRRSRAWQHSAA